MKSIVINFVAIICIFTACFPDNISEEVCDIEKFPFSHFQQIASEFGEFQQALKVENSGFVVLLEGAQTNLVRFTYDLEVLWVGRFDFKFIHSDLLQNKQGGYTILGTTSEETILLDISSMGVLVDQKKVGNTKARLIKQIVSDGHNGIIAVGSNFEGNSQGKSFFMRIDSTHELAWEKSFNNFDSESAVSIVSERSGEFSVLNTFSGISFGTSAYVNRIDLEGRILDSKQTFYNLRRAQKMVMQKSNDGLKIVATTGRNDSDNSFNEDILIVKLDKQDSVSWYTFSGGHDAEDFKSIIQTKDDDYLIVGTTRSCSLLPQALYLAKVSSEGKRIWERIYGGSFLGQKSIIEKTNGEIIIITSSQETDALLQSTTQVLRIDREGRPI